MVMHKIDNMGTRIDRTMPKMMNDGQGQKDSSAAAAAAAAPSGSV